MSDIYQGRKPLRERIVQSQYLSRDAIQTGTQAKRRRRHAERKHQSKSYIHASRNRLKPARLEDTRIILYCILTPLL